MCFGMQETQRTNTTNDTNQTRTASANPYVQSAATSNLDFAKQLRDSGFQAYGGEQVAPFSGQQMQSFDMANAIAGNGTGQQAGGLINKYASAPAASVNAGTISSRMSPYMNQYVMQALQPQMYQMDINDAKQRQATDATATSSGAFGDARTGVEQGVLAQGQGINRAGVIGSAYDKAFNTAIGAGAQDVSNDLSAQNANAGYYEQALARALGGSTALQNLQNQQMGVAKGVNEFGQQQTAQDQAKLTAQYNQWLMAQQYPFMSAGLVNSTTNTAANAMPAAVNTVGSGTQVESRQQPNNAGWALAGNLLSSAMMFI